PAVRASDQGSLLLASAAGARGTRRGDQSDWSNFAAGIAERVCLAARQASRPVVVAQGAPGGACVLDRLAVAAPNAAVSLSLVQRQGGIALGRSSSCARSRCSSATRCSAAQRSWTAH